MFGSGHTDNWPSVLHTSWSAVWTFKHLHTAGRRENWLCLYWLIGTGSTFQDSVTGTITFVWNTVWKSRHLSLLSSCWLWAFLDLLLLDRVILCISSRRWILYRTLADSTACLIVKQESCSETAFARVRGLKIRNRWDCKISVEGKYQTEDIRARQGLYMPQGPGAVRGLSGRCPRSSPWLLSITRVMIICKCPPRLCDDHIT